MPASQLSAVLGGRKKIRPGYVSAINARTPYLPAQRAAEDDRAYQEDTLALQERELAENVALTREQMEEQKKQGRTANVIAGGNALLSGGMNAASLRNDILGGGSSTGTGITTGTATPLTASETAESEARLGGSSLMPTLGGFAGAGAGYALSKDSDNTLIKYGAPVVGAVAGNALAGGDLYKDIGGYLSKGCDIAKSFVGGLFS